MAHLLRKFVIPALAAAFALGLFVFQALPALACGGLVAPDGDVRLACATTFIAWHQGIERYLTAFTYQGNEANVGPIAPSPCTHIGLNSDVKR